MMSVVSSRILGRFHFSIFSITDRKHSQETEGLQDYLWHLDIVQYCVGHFALLLINAN